MPALSITTAKQRQHAPSGKQQAIPLPWTNPAACKSFPAMQRVGLTRCMAHSRCGLRTHIPVRLPRSWIARAQLRPILHRHARIGIAYRRRCSDASMSAYARGRLMRGACAPDYVRHVRVSLPQSACVFHSRSVHAFRLLAKHALILMCGTCVHASARHIHISLPNDAPVFHSRSAHAFPTSCETCASARYMRSRLRAVRAFLLLSSTCAFRFHTVHAYFTAAWHVPSCFPLNMRSCLLATNTLPTLHDICVPASNWCMRSPFRAASTHLASTQRVHISPPHHTCIPYSTQRTHTSPPHDISTHPTSPSACSRQQKNSRSYRFGS